MKKPELLAPAGDMDCFMAAVNAGADAVYLGGEEYGARAYASNFSREELCEAICYAHLFGVKVYLTVNTLVKEREFDNLEAFIRPFYDVGLDGVIVQDFGVLYQLSEAFEGLELHASTQMAIANSYGADFLKRYGVCRIVPARELSMDELNHIRDEVPIEIETFIHGAMCYCYSGHCLYSSFLGGRSGNRGRCAGPCRLPFDVFKNKEVYPLSLKDMCTISILPELIDNGIDSFKIEGRMKNPYYVAGVTSVYRKYIDLYLQNRDSRSDFKVSESDYELLKKLYLRSDLQDGYFHRHNGREMITMHSPGYAVADDKELENIKKLYLDTKRKVSLDASIVLQIGEPAVLTVWDGIGHVSCVQSEEIVLQAQKRPVSESDIQKQINKTGNTPFHFNSVSVIMDDNIFVSLKILGEVKRQALDRIREQILEDAGKRQSSSGTDDEAWSGAAIAAADDIRIQRYPETGNGRFRVSCQTIGQLKHLISVIPAYEEIDSIELQAFLLSELDQRLVQELLRMKKAAGIGVYLRFPPVFRKRASDWMSKYLSLMKSDLFNGFYCNNLDSLAYIQQYGLSGNKHIMADHGLYIFNAKAAAFFSSHGVRGMVVPYELTHYEWLDFQKAVSDHDMDSEYLLYGHIPFMRTANCIKKTFDKCNGKNEVTMIKDRTHTVIPVLNQCEVCENTIYNSVPVSLHDEKDKIKADYFRLAFTVENEEQMTNVLDIFIKGNGRISYEYTKGHFKKGIE